MQLCLGVLRVRLLQFRIKCQSIDETQNEIVPEHLFLSITFLGSMPKGLHPYYKTDI